MRTREQRLRTAIGLCSLTVAWNVVAGTASVVVGATIGSLSLLGFGLDAAVDSIASATLV